MGVQAAPSSTVICPECKPAPSTPDIVTRSPVPTTPCTAPPLTAVPVVTTSTKTTTTVYTVTKCPSTATSCTIGKPTTEVITYTTAGTSRPVPTNSKGVPSSSVVPVAGARSNMVVGGVGGVLAIAAAAAVLM